MIENRKEASALLFSPAAIIFLIALAVAGTFYPLWSRSQGGSAFDIAVFASAAATFLQSIFGLVVNNFIFLGQNKNWQDFWRDRPFEFFHIDSNEKLEPWRLARGRFLFYLVGVCLASGAPFLYLLMRASL
ncbi:MAG: hypothetical protein ACJ8GW_11665 [Massilia sp.]